MGGTILQNYRVQFLILFCTPLALVFIGQGCQKSFKAGSSDSPQVTVLQPGDENTLDGNPENQEPDSDDPVGNDPNPAAPPSGKVPMFVAAGRGGRTIVSCDDGRTWIGDRSIDNDNRDHAPTVDKGFAYGDGVFIQVMGWGYDAQIQRSEDGFNWETIQFPHRMGAMAYTGKKFMVFGNNAHVSSDGGKTWEEVSKPEHGTHAREGGGGGEPNGPSIVAIGSGTAPKFTMDEGQTWLRAPAVCDSAINFGGVGQRAGMVYGNRTFLVLDSDGNYCSTPDYGLNWVGGSLTQNNDAGIGGKVAFARDHFWALAGSHAYRSPNARDWERIDFSPNNVNIHLIAKSERGTYVGIDRSSSSFYRSQDGENWEFVATHANGLTLSRLRFGYATASNQCPE